MHKKNCRYNHVFSHRNRILENIYVEVANPDERGQTVFVFFVS